jgi:glutaminyl-peptide cyclotransferase
MTRCSPLSQPLLALVAIAALTACTSPSRDADQDFAVTSQYPHDTSAYTQGLVWNNGTLYESTGRYGLSELRRVDLNTGRVLASRALPANRFGEGLALLRNRLYQLTWQSGIAYTYDATTLAPLDSIPYRGEGWGLTTTDSLLALSDGSDSIRFLDPATFATRRVIHVTYQGGKIFQLNELEYVGGTILANVYQTNHLVRIDPATGNVTQLLDCAELFPQRPAFAEVMNGIALSPVPGELLLTGKLWPTMFRVRLKKAEGP